MSHADLEVLAEISQAVTTDNHYGIEFVHGRYHICLLQEDGRAIRVIGSGEETWEEARDMLYRIEGIPLPKSEWQVWAMVIVFAVFVAWVMWRWLV